MEKLDQHSSMIFEEYLSKIEVFDKMKEKVLTILNDCLRQNNLLVTAVEARVKEAGSLSGKLKKKGSKYNSISDITDILGARIITFYSDDVDKIAALVEEMFVIDWANSVDKRKMHQLDSFGYLSLHYICSIPKSLYFDPQYPEINEYRFEIQLRSALQHVWANVNHDSGYKNNIEIPREYLRKMNRLAGLLELADAEISQLRRDMIDYQRQVEALAKGGNFSNIPLTQESFRSYLELKPFALLLERIASLNQAEIIENSHMPYYEILLRFGFNSLADIDDFIKKYGEDAYELARRQIGKTDLDIISSTVALQDLCIVYIIERGGREEELLAFFNYLGGTPQGNEVRVKRILELSAKLSFMNR